MEKKYKGTIPFINQRFFENWWDNHYFYDFKWSNHFSDGFIEFYGQKYVYPPKKLVWVHGGWFL